MEPMTRSTPTEPSRRLPPHRPLPGSMRLLRDLPVLDRRGAGRGRLHRSVRAGTSPRARPAAMTSAACGWPAPPSTRASAAARDRRWCCWSTSVRATMQHAALAEVFTGRRGGPLGELAAMLGRARRPAQREDRHHLGRRRPPRSTSTARCAAGNDTEGRAVRPGHLPGGSRRWPTSSAPRPCRPLHRVPRRPRRTWSKSIDVKGRSANTGWFSYTG